MKRQTKVTEKKKSEEEEEEAMKGQKRLTRREMLKLSGTVAAGSLLAACAPAVPQIVKETVVVPQTVIVPQTVQVPAPTTAPATPAPTATPAPVTLEVFNPGGSYEVSQLFSPRLNTLEGKKICLVSSYYHGAQKTMPVIAELLKKKFPTATIIPETKFTSIYWGGTQAERASIGKQVKDAGCDAVIVGNGG
jgi:hypothetical protein